jgi:hypothetical protein
MTAFNIGDRVRRTEPPFSTGTVDLKEGQTIWVVLDNNGGRACYPFDKLELETPDPSRDEEPRVVRRIPYGR